MSSLWIDARDSTRPAPSGDTWVDVVVVGGGITGIATAARLAESGLTVSVLEARRVGEGDSGRSTGNLYATVSHGLATLRNKWNAAQVRQVVVARSEAIDWVEQMVRRYGIECGFRRVPLHQCVADPGSPALAELRAEHQAALDAGLAPEWREQVEGWPLELAAVSTLPGQAQFNPYRFVTGLAEHLAGLGVSVHEDARVVDIDAGKGVVTTMGGRVHADTVVLATHTPPGVNLLQAEMEPFLEYGVAVPLPQPLAAASLWVKDASRSLRTHEEGGRRWLVAVGGKHKTGEGGSGADHHARLSGYLQGHFGTDQPTHAWSAQQFRPADELPYIGRSAHGNVLVATGFAADGLAWGVAASALICDLVQGRESDLAGLLSPRRFTPVKSASGWASENASVARHMLKDRLDARGAAAELADLAHGTGQVMKVAGEVSAVYRDQSGRVTALSPVCPHMGCYVQWNPSAATWDCPCHGSRFDTSGTVISGPSLSGLEQRRLDG